MIITLLFWIVILAIFAGVVQALITIEPYRTVALAFCLLMLVLLVFGFFGVGPGLPDPGILGGRR